jgi:dihydrofolate reductase
MRKVVVTEYLSLDGVIEAPNQWSFPYWNDEIAKFKYDELFASDTFLLGRVTYQEFAAAWPTMQGTGEFGERMNSLPKFVASRTVKQLEWNANLLEGDISAAVTKLKGQAGQDILVHGSGDFVQTLRHHDLVDEYHLLVYPILFGSGKRLFEEGARAPLKLVESRSFASGVVLMTYQPDRTAK